MSAAELRRAAETLRARAASVPKMMETSGAWNSGIGFRRDEGSWFHLAPTTFEQAQRADFQAASTYIATMHPGVGLALADWLEFAAETALGWERIGHLEPSRWPEPTRMAHAIARLINGGAS